MLIHHDGRDYETAASEAAKVARERLGRMIERGTASATAVIEKVHNEVPQDYIVPTEALQFYTEGNAVRLGWKGAEPRALHDNAYGQVLSRAGLPKKFGDMLLEQGDWGADLLAHNLGELYGHKGGRNLVRELNGRVGGFLSDSYRRIDSRQTLEAFCQACQQVGAVPVDGFSRMHTKVSLKALSRTIYEPVPNEVTAFGLSWQDSQYGDGGHAIRFFALRLWCTNTALGEDLLRQVHVGGKLSEDIKFSTRTYELDSARSASMVDDIVRHAFSEARIQGHLEAVRRAHEEHLSAKQAAGVVKSLPLTKAQQAEVVETYNSPDVEMLPAGNSRWRLSNALSWVAQAQEDQRQQQHFEDLAGKVLHPRGPVKVA